MTLLGLLWIFAQLLFNFKKWVEGVGQVKVTATVHIAYQTIGAVTSDTADTAR